MSRITEDQAFAEGGDDALDDVVATCLESGSDEIDDAVARACLEHPSSADEIRRRIGRLRKLGLLRPPGAQEDERFPEQLGEFRLLERLGGGGMGVVFRARQETLGRDVALKLIRPEHLYFPRARERFRRETEAAARLQHPGLVPIHTVGEANGIPFFAMELVSGATLAEALRELRAHIPEKLRGDDLAQALQHCTPPFSTWNAEVARAAFAGAYIERVVHLVIQVADALQHAHSRGVLHRDVKPSNIAVTHDARAMLFDFGLASLGDSAERLTKSRAEIGSLAYMSPEQLVGSHDSVDPRSDLYSLGVSLYELLALQLPFAEAASLETRRAILEGRCEPLRSRNRAVSRDLEIVCAKAMERDKAGRYADAAAFARDLRNVLEKRPIEARPPGPALRVVRAVQRHPIATTVLAALIGVPTALLWMSSSHARELGQALADTELARGNEESARKTAQIDAREAREINEFLIDLFESVDPGVAMGREVSARDLVDEAARRLETELTDQPLVRARLMNTIAESYMSLGAFDQAEGLLERALELNRAHAGERSLAMAETLRELSTLEYHLGRPAALEHGRQAVELYEELAPTPSVELGITITTYALALQGARRLDEAEAAYHKALAVLEALSPPEPARSAVVWNNLAYLQLEREDFEAAIASAREAIRLGHERDPAPQTADTSSLNAMALAFTVLERFDEARAIYDQILDQERRLTGERSPQFATFLSSKANLELETGHTDDAIRLLEQASPLLARTMRQSDNSMHCEEQLGLAYQVDARWENALDTFLGVMPTIDTVAGAASLRALTNHVRIALCHEALSDASAAEVELSDALQRAAEAAAGEDNAWEASAAAMLACLLARRGEIDGARELVQRARSLHDDSELTSEASIWTRLAVGVVAQAEGDAERAREELAELARLHSTSHFATIAFQIARAHLAVLLVSTEPTRARELATRARDELERALGPEHPETRALAEWLDSAR